MVDKLSNLVGPHRNDALVAAVLAHVFLLKHNAGDAADFELLGRNVLAGGAARNGAYDFLVFGIRSGQAFEVCKRWWFDGVMENGGGGGGGGRLTEMAEMKAVCKDLTMADQHQSRDREGDEWGLPRVSGF